MLSAIGARTANRPGKGPRQDRLSHVLPPKLLWLQITALLVLAFATVALLQRGERLKQGSERDARDRALVELVSLAVGSDLSFSDGARFLRILERTARDGRVVAGAVLGPRGEILAHTDVARVGGHPDLHLGPDGSLPDDTAPVKAALFGQHPGRVVLHPILGTTGRVGTVALLMPEARRALFDASSLKYILPAALLLLAFVAFTTATIRQAIEPTSSFLERLSTVLPSPSPARDGSESCAQAAGLMEQAVARINELQEAREMLTIENRVLDYERRRKGLILDHLPDGLIMTDAGDKVVYVNRAAAALLACSVEELDGRELKTLPPEPARMLRETHNAGQAVHTLKREDKERQILLSRICLNVAHNGKAGTLYTLRDVTAQQAAQRAQAEFLSQISHELKTPLNTMVTYVDALAEEGLLSHEERKEYSNTLREEAHRMARLIANLLQLSRIELGNLSARFGFVKSSTLIASLAESLRSQLQARGQSLTVDVPDNLPPLYGDKDLLGVALTNLLTNAIKYTPEKGSIAVRATAGNSDLTIEVEDTGIGISEDEKGLIFERFQRSSREEVQRVAGSGLGLALVKEIVEVHEGAITVDSTPGKGSCFRVQLPIREVGQRLDTAA
jgi:two-component system, OmpR family, phosphate regulon sensor histidine kinase PhoR